VKVTPAFRRTISAVGNGELLVPLFRSAVADPKFKGFTIKVDGHDVREPDGWFHPSTHPTVDERHLYYYLAHPEGARPEYADPSFVLAVTQGSFWHDFIQNVLLHVGAIERNPDPKPGMNPAEWGWAHEETRSRGHSDGIVSASISGQREILEIKSMNANRQRKIPQGPPDSPEVIEAFKALDLGYYAQGQEYMRISGLRRWRAIFIAIEYPYPMREVVMDYNPFFAGEIAMKYERVIQAVADQRPPGHPCFGKAIQECPYPGLCPEGTP
jgi:hypothetical protein